MIKYSLLFFTFLMIHVVAYTQATTSSFTSTYTKACVGGEIAFTNTSSGSIISSNWDFGDGTVSILSGKQNASHVFANSGKYEVGLTIISSTGSAVEYKKIIEVIQKPILDFTIEGNKCEIPANLIISNNSIKTDGINYSWNFGNGQSTTIYSPGTITYSNTGKYSINLQVETSLPGCVVAPQSKSIQIYDFKATVSGSDIFCSKTGTKLVAKSSMPVDIYQWNFGDGSSGINNDTVFAEFKKPGSFVVDLKIVNNSIQCESHAFFKVTSKPLPAPVFSVSSTKICPGFTVSFTNSSIAMSEYVWDFGDGTNFQGKDPSAHLYKSEGKINVSLTAKSSNGCYGTTVHNGLIEVFNPVVDITSDTNSGCSILPVQFSDLSKSNDEVNNPIKFWDWDFGNGISFSGKTPTVQKFDVGKFDISLKITTVQGCVVQKTFNQFIKVGKIDVVDFKSLQVTGCANSLIGFKDNSTINSPHDPSELTYDWIFSDTTRDAGAIINHRFSKDTGMIHIKFYIHFRGCSDSIFKNNVLRVKPPLAKFTPDTTLFCFNKDVLPYLVNNKFSDKSKLGKNGDAIDVFWNYGDGQSGVINNVNPTSLQKGSINHNFTDFGTYRVLQTIKNYSTECQDTISKLFHISWVKPSFEISVDSVCQFSPVKLQDKSVSFSKHPIIDYSYETGEGTNVKGISTSYSYLGYGKMFAKNHPQNSVGCSQSTKDSVTVIKLPQAEVTPDLDSSCAPGSISFLNKSTLSGNALPFKMFYWNLPDKGLKDSTSNINLVKTQSYLKVGRYFVTLAARDIFGCLSKIDTAWVNLFKPESKIEYNSVVCNNSDFKIFNKTINWVNNTWTIDGNFIGKDKDTITYQFNDNKKLGISKSHTIVLISLDKKKCRDTLVKTITVSMPKAEMEINFQNLNDTSKHFFEFKCPPLSANYKNISQSIGSFDSTKWVFSKNSFSFYENPIKIYTKPGLYSTNLKVVDQFGCTDDTIEKDFLKINGPKGYPVWSGMGDVCGQYYKFELKNMDKVQKIVWDLDDGTILQDSILFKHRFSEIKTYKPIVTLTDSENCSVAYLMEEPDTLIKIPETGLDAKFNVSSIDIKLGQKLLIQDLSNSPNQPLVKWKWNYDFPNKEYVDSFTNSLPISVFYSKYGTKKIRLTITDKDECSDQYELKINVIKDIDMPNVFTPNQDGINDNFEFFDTIFKSYDLYVYSRWGNELFDIKGGKGVFLWDGQNKSKVPMDDGLYYYYLLGTFDDNSTLEKKGSITISKD